LFEVTRCPDPGYEKDFWIECSAFDWDGSRFSIFSYDFWIKQFPRGKPINSLVIYPLKEYRNLDGSNGLEQLKEKLTKRARSYVAMCTQEPGIVQCDYQGTALVTPTALHSLTSKGRGQAYGLQSSDDNDEIEAASIEMTGKKSRVIIDNLSFVKSGRNTMKLGNTPPLGKRIVSFSIECVCSVCKTSVVQRWRPTSTFDEPLDALGKAFMEDEDRLLYLPPRLLGYAVNHKVWGQFSVEKLEVVSPTIDIDKNGPYWKELELEEESKNHLMAFVQHHRTWRDRKPTPGNENKAADNLDIIEGKGQGLVVLRHGPPGVGKTLTADTIAMATGRPLLTVSVAEIGVAYQQAEKNLTEVFVDATRWEAVLLMDEAEVFVEQRSTQDLERNAFVSVMLRCLEYFEGKPKSTYHHLSALLLQHTGIVIMTTNRAKAIDVAI
jgi:hypothetical protein